MFDFLLSWLPTYFFYWLIEAADAHLDWRLKIERKRLQRGIAQAYATPARPITEEEVQAELARRMAPIDDDCLDEPTPPRPESAPSTCAWGFSTETPAAPAPPPEALPLSLFPEVQARAAEDPLFPPFADNSLHICAGPRCMRTAPAGKLYCESCDPF